MGRKEQNQSNQVLRYSETDKKTQALHTERQKKSKGTGTSLDFVLPGVPGHPLESHVQALPALRRERNPSMTKWWDWTKNLDKKWSPEKVKQIQKKLGIEDETQPGTYDYTTRLYHTAYFMARDLNPRGLKETMAGYNKQKASVRMDLATQERATEIAERRAKSDLRMRAFSSWKDWTGQSPTEGNTEWMGAKFEEGWSQWDLYKFMRNSPGFERRYPGIGEHMMPSTYDTMKARANGIWMRQQGREITPGEFNKLIKGGYKNTYQPEQEQRGVPPTE